MLAAALLVLVIVLPTAAVAQESGEAPLSDVPKQYEPALRAAADGLGLSYDELTSASEEELQTMLCGELADTPTDQIVAQARTALKEAPADELAELSDAERKQLIANLPAIIAQVESQYCDDDAATSGDVEDDDATASGDDASSEDDGEIPVPTRIDTGGGGAGGAGMVPAAFGALFAALFGLVGVGVTRRSTG